MTTTSTLTSALETLSAAHGKSALLAAFAELQRVIRRQRRDPEAGVLAATLREAIRLWDAAKADGVSQPERVAALEKTLRAVWPYTREWKYLCQSCRDAGLVMAECPGDASCGRERAHHVHEYGTPCWCSRGEAFKLKQPPAADFTAAGKTTKRLTRMGR